MNEEEQKIDKKDLTSRRSFLKDLFAAAVGGPVAVLGGVDAGKKVTDVIRNDLGIIPQIHSQAELEKFAENLKDLYGLEVTVDLWTGGHIPAMPQDPSNTLILGEFAAKWITMTGKIEDDEEVNQDSELRNAGIELVGANVLRQYQLVSNSVPLILASDNNGNAFSDYFKNKLVSDLDLDYIAYLDFINTHVPKVIAAASLGAKTLGDVVGSVRASMAGRVYSRRDVLSLGGVMAASALATVITREVTDRLKMDEVVNQTLTFELSDQPDYIQDLVLIHNPFNRFVRDIRDINMLLRESAYAATDLTNDLTTVQVSQANGHRNIFSLSNDIPAAELACQEHIRYIIDSHLDVIKKYPHRFEEIRSAVVSSLVLDFGLFSPLLMRLNPSVKEEFKLDYVRSKVTKDTVCSEPWLLLCRTLVKMQESLDPESPEYLVLHEAFHITTFSNTNIFDYIVPEFEMGPTGNENAVDEELTIFGMYLRFSKGLLVTSTYD